MFFCDFFISRYYNNQCGSGLVCLLSRQPSGAVPGCTGGEDDPTATHYCIKEAEAARDDNNGAVVLSVNVVNGANPDGGVAVNEQQQESSALSQVGVSLASVASALLLGGFM